LERRKKPVTKYTLTKDAHGNPYYALDVDRTMGEWQHPEHMQDESWPKGWVGDIREDLSFLVKQAAINTGFSIWVTAGRTPGYVGIFSLEKPGKDHGPLWEELKQLEKVSEAWASDQTNLH
jgi:hypothetical protein